MLKWGFEYATTSNMTSTPYTIVIDNHHIQCDSAASVIALLRASKSPMSAPSKAAASTPSAAPPAKKQPKASKAPKVKKTSAKKGRKSKASKKSTGLSKRSVAFLNEFARSGGSTLSADRLARATGAKGPKGVGGSLTALDRELKSFGYSLGSLIARKKTDDGTVWNATSGSERTISEILSKVPVVG